MSVFLYAEINLVCILALGIMAGRILRTPRPDPAWGLFIRMACCAIALFVTDLVWNLAEHAPTPVSAGRNFCLNASASRVVTWVLTVRRLRLSHLL